jgi:hypothetical protein
MAEKKKKKKKRISHFRLLPIGCISIFRFQFEKKRWQQRRDNTLVPYCFKLSILDTVYVYVYVSFLIKFDDKLNEKDAINLKQSSIMCVCDCICMCNSLSPIVLRHHHLDLHFYGLLLSQVNDCRDNTQYNWMQQVLQEVYIYVYSNSKNNSRRK